MDEIYDPKVYVFTVPMVYGGTREAVYYSDYLKVEAERDEFARCLSGGTDCAEDKLALRARVAALEAALTKVHGIIAEYWGPCMGSVECLLTLREAIGPHAKGWGPSVIARETPVSTLCAVCDQIKELHPRSHPWTAKASAKETKGDANVHD